MQTFVFTLLTLLLGCQTGGGIMNKDSRYGRRGDGGADFEKAVSAAPGRKLRVRLETGGTVALSGWDKGEVAVTARLGGPDGRDTGVELSDAPDGVLLAARYNGSKQSYATDLSFDVKVPRRFDVQIDSSGGGVTLTGLEGDFSGHTNGGRLTLSETKGRVDLSTGGGDITLARSELSGRVSTGGGNVIIKGVRGDVQAQTGGGSVIRQDSDDGGDAVTRDAEGGGTGGQALDGEGGDVGGALKIRKAGGAIEVADAPEGADVETGGGHIHVGSARRFVRAQTGGGEIVIDSVDGWVRATTGAGDVRVTLTGGGGDRDVTISSSAGDVTLVAPPDLSARFDLKLAYTKTDRPYSIDSDFAVERRATGEWSTAEGTARKYVFGSGSVGGGRGLVKIQTINGSIHVRKGR